jgi:hypothetical protein
MKAFAALGLAALWGLFVVGFAVADDAAPTTRPMDEQAPAAMRPGVQALKDRVTACEDALARAEADCIRRLEASDDYKAAEADLQIAQKALDDASDPDSRAQAASSRMAAKEHLIAMKAQALASDKTVAAAAAAQREASDAYRNAVLQDSAAATVTQAKANLQSGDAAEDEDEAIKEMLRRGEAKRLANIKWLLDDIRSLDDKLGQLPEDSNTESRRNEISDQIIKERQLIAMMQSEKGHYLPDLEMKVGSTGAIYDALHVFQVIDGNDMLLSLGEDSVCWVKGIDTTGLTDDQEFKFHHALRVTGTKQYTTAAGSLRTVFVIEPFGPDNP